MWGKNQQSFVNVVAGVTKRQKINEFLAGLTSAMTMIPESLSFAIIAGLNPLMGLYAAFIMGIVTCVLGGRPGMISGGAGATIIVMVALIKFHGVEYLLAAVVLGGLIQIIVGVLKLGKFVRLIPQSVMYGFLNGLAVVIFLAQINQLGIWFSFEHGLVVQHWFYPMLALVILSILIVVFWPLVSKAIPASLVSIMVVSLVVFYFSIDTKKLIDIAQIQGGFPKFHIPEIPFNWESLSIIFPYALIMACVGLLESLLTLQMVDEITYSKGNANKEVKAQGLANVLCGFFGAMGGCAMVGQTMVNLKSKGRTRISGIVSALSILLILLVGGSVIGQIPVAALIGVMIVVAFTTFKWASFKMIFTMPVSDVLIGMLVALITIFMHNLALAVFTGVILSALVFAWENAKQMKVERICTTDKVIYRCHGPLFFGSASSFAQNFTPLEDPEEIVVDFTDSKVCDMSAIEQLNKLTKVYKEHNKIIVLRHLSGDCCLLLDNAKDVVELHIQTDPTYKVMA